MDGDRVLRTETDADGRASFGYVEVHGRQQWFAVPGGWPTRRTDRMADRARAKARHLGALPLHTRAWYWLVGVPERLRPGVRRWP